jgi:flavin reductase (DIM6/NTAB) family NADH-FMN oxidoreductase RutF
VLEEDDAMSEQNRASGSLLSFFWTPVVAVGCAAPDKLNAQISVSTFGASIVPQQPRLLSVLYKGNLTHGLVAAKGSFSISVLDASQTDLLPKLGFVSGRDRDKLAGLEVGLTALGNPVLHGALGWLDCRVIDAFDLGDATAYLAAVVEEQALRWGTPMVWSQVRRSLPQAWLDEWDTKIARDIERSLASMRWLVGRD